MKYLSRARFGLAAAAVLSAGAAVIATNPPAQSISPERIARLPKPQQARWTEYWDRSKKTSITDRAKITAEMTAAGLKEALVPPGSNSTRSIPLNRPAEWYASAEARHVADIVVSFQTPAGGWSKNLNLTDHVRKPGESFAPDNRSRYLSPDDFDTPHDVTWNYVGTLDNDATTTEIQFLAKVAAGADGATSAPYRAAVLRGIDYLFASQFPNGGWPQVWPLEGGYHDAITFNDGADTHALEVLQQVAEGHEAFAFVPGATRARAAEAVSHGLDCIVACQIPVNGKRTVWGQQHDALTLQPVSGRNYEPPAECSSESAELMQFLMGLPKPGTGIMQAVDAAAAWFRKTLITGVAWRRGGADGPALVAAPDGGPIWARFYEIGTDRPEFGDRDKTIHDKADELSRERRQGYSWYNGAPQAALDRYAEWSKLHPAR